jgi:hypothetical protein
MYVCMKPCMYVCIYKLDCVSQESHPNMTYSAWLEVPGVITPADIAQEVRLD